MLYKSKIREDDFYNLDKLINKTEIRNIIIRAYWEGLKHSSYTYEGKINIVSKEFIISPSLVERIIYLKNK